MIGHHLSASDFWNARKRLRRLLLARRRGKAEIGEALAAIAGSASASIIAALSFATMSFGVSFGAQSPYQSDGLEARQPGLVGGRNVGRGAQRVFDVTA